MPTIAIIEDDVAIRKLVCYALENQGHKAYGYGSAEAYFSSAIQPDLVILDIMLPETDGISILKTLREHPDSERLPILMLTALGNEYDKVKALDLGADDYLTKPFGVMELLARVRALLRRSDYSAPQNDMIRTGPLVLDSARRQLTMDGKEVPLTFKEFELLRYLMLNVGLVLSRDQIMQAVWGFEFEGESRTVDMHIRLLRQKLKENGNMIQTVRGVGYKLDEGDGS